MLCCNPPNSPKQCVFLSSLFKNKAVMLHQKQLKIRYNRDNTKGFGRYIKTGSPKKQKECSKKPLTCNSLNLFFPSKNSKEARQAKKKNHKERKKEERKQGREQLKRRREIDRERERRRKRERERGGVKKTGQKQWEKLKNLPFLGESRIFCLLKRNKRNPPKRNKARTPPP